jgi:hypothetical protein
MQLKPYGLFYIIFMPSNNSKLAINLLFFEMLYCLSLKTNKLYKHPLHFIHNHLRWKKSIKTNYVPYGSKPWRLCRYYIRLQYSYHKSNTVDNGRRYSKGTTATGLHLTNCHHRQRRRDVVNSPIKKQRHQTVREEKTVRTSTERLGLSITTLALHHLFTCVTTTTLTSLTLCINRMISVFFFTLLCCCSNKALQPPFSSYESCVYFFFYSYQNNLIDLPRIKHHIRLPYQVSKSLNIANVSYKFNDF